MELRFARFSQGLAQDPTTRRIWFGIATAHDFESHLKNVFIRTF
jgi:photosystem I P700 chlorophyll a apoprotein A2